MIEKKEASKKWWQLWKWDSINDWIYGVWASNPHASRFLPIVAYAICGINQQMASTRRGLSAELFCIISMISSRQFLHLTHAFSRSSSSRPFHGEFCPNRASVSRLTEVLLFSCRCPICGSPLLSRVSAVSCRACICASPLVARVSSVIFFENNFLIAPNLR